MVKKVEVKQSHIHGMGLFAKHKIYQGEVIGAIKPKPAKKNGPHVLWVTAEEGHKVDGPLKFINHCPNPNACYYDDLTVVALQDIAPGDEITHDYGDGWGVK